MLFRNRPLVRAMACLCLVETITSIITPSLSVAMMGPGQPEITSYESPGSTDMVSLTTGDLTYNIPALDIPGPERSFSLPLTYRAGIRPEQEASWVGLGWSLNAGAIARGLNGYPDDAANDPYSSTFTKDVAKGWSGGVPGLLDLGWDSETGHSGTADLLGLASVGWAGGQVSSGDLVGVKYARGQGVSVDPVRMFNAAMTIATVGAGATVGIAGQATQSIGTQVGIQAATTAGVGLAVGGAMMLGKKGGISGGYNRPAVRTRRHFLSTNYWVFYNDNKQERMYGSLNFQEMSKEQNLNDDNNGYKIGPPIYRDVLYGSQYKARPFLYQRSYDGGSYEQEVGADVYQYAAQGENSYIVTGSRPTSIAHDDFSVMGEGVSGSIRPQRLEVGTISFPKKMTDTHEKYNLVSFLDDYKVPFRYENSLSNGYDYHDYIPPVSTANWDGIDHDANATGDNSLKGALIIRDPRLMELDNNTAPRTGAARKGLYNRPDTNPATNPMQDPRRRDRRLVQGKHIQWYSNEEILKMYENSTEGNGTLLEFAHPKASTTQEITGYRLVCPTPYRTDCYQQPIYKTVTSNNPFRKTLPKKGIGAFVVTAEDGTTYHYSLPVYHYTQYGHSIQKKVNRNDAAQSTQTMGGPTSGFAYATAWLLTAITSADYIDRNHNGVVDDSDWGGWVAFNYGKFASQYKWRQPYLGESLTPDGTNGSYSEGYKETYYLNSIHTRTHTALFVKSARQDGRGHFTAAGGETHLGIDEQAPSSSLRLDEIALLTNEDLNALKTALGATGAENEPVGFLLNPQQNATTFDANELRNKDSYASVLDQHDLMTNTQVRDYLAQHALKRVIFNYSYRLCPGTPNAFASLTTLPDMPDYGAPSNRTGKLTLEGVAIYGPQNTKLMPDFQFTYGSNPTYGRDKWDGFGMYNRTGTDTGHSIPADYATASEDGAAWSLTEILNPLGGRTQITYERDQYSAVSEYDNGTYTSYVLHDRGLAEGQERPTGVLDGDGSVDLTTLFKPSDVVHTQGSVFSRYELQDWDNTTNMSSTTEGNCDLIYEHNDVLKEVTPNSLTLTELPPAPNPDISHCIPANTSQHTYQGNYLGYGGFVTTIRIPKNKNGGDIRVAAITTVDEQDHRYQVRYRYNRLLNSAVSTGVISKEPDYVKQVDHPFYQWYDYPSTPVLYGKVTVLRGTFRNGQDLDYDQREEYNFYTPESRMVLESTDSKGGDFGDMNTPLFMTLRRITHIGNHTKVDLGKIGQPQAVRKYNRRGELEFATTFNYASTLTNTDGLAGQGKFTEGTLTAELVSGEPYISYLYRLNRSTKEYLPTVLRSTTTVANGVQSVNSNERYDFYTGQVLETTNTNSLGDTYQTKTIPAYTLAPYASMGARGDNAAYPNMLTQTAASYVYKRAPSGQLSVVSAGIQTWKGAWDTYRRYNETTDRYEQETEVTPAVWRQHASYVWNTPQLNADGTYAGFVDIDWTRPLTSQNSGWLQVGEVTRYDHYSKPLETKDVNGLFTTQKLGYQQTQVLASAANARYTEIAYSGAEDQFPLRSGSLLHFGGEVRDGGRQDHTQAHTGEYSSKLTAHQLGFTYKAVVGNAQEVGTNRKYRLSAWVYGNDVGVGNGRLYASLDGIQVAETSIKATSTKKAGAWYLLNVYFDVPTSATGKQLTVGCRNAGAGEVYFDDFRFQPVDGPMTTYVYDLATRQPTFVLDNDNLYTHYEYDAAGKVTTVYKEALDRPGDTSTPMKLVKQYQYNYGRRAAYLNQEMRKTLAPDNCPGGSQPQLVTYVVPAGKYTSGTSLEDANAQAQADITANAQTYANNAPDACKSCLPAGTILCEWNQSDNANPADEWMCFTYRLIADGNCGSYQQLVGMGAGKCYEESSPCSGESISGGQVSKTQPQALNRSSQQKRQ
ncbi:DUF5977 domain-containing protein [Hymenobacter cavernae]|uniref:DUF5977 domain-containing protein n=1 Tax=Hymenobacter cavernae TaxID=2044852 RepID=A0ABQ1UXP5_9BACT|nr:DUF5977 domain-containing protein [Hymenobacter cavernae]GGF27922.1 hypothetical protein GCM10011383_44530 [Hymenobacter cavernae]